MVNTRGDGFLGVSHVPVQGASASPTFLGPTCTHTVWGNHQILHGDQSSCEADSYAVDHECRHAICWGS